MEDAMLSYNYLLGLMEKEVLQSEIIILFQLNQCCHEDIVLWLTV